MHFAPEFKANNPPGRGLGHSHISRIEHRFPEIRRYPAKSCGLGIIGFSDLRRQDPPDLVFVLGDRFEMFAAPSTYLPRLIAHIAGGDVTSGSLDDGMRHAISKLASAFHNQAAAERLRRMGESEARVHMTESRSGRHSQFGAAAAGDRLSPRMASATKNPPNHNDPDTGSKAGDDAELRALFSALERLDPDLGMLFTLPNADAGGRAATAATMEFASGRENTMARASLGRELIFPA